MRQVLRRRRAAPLLATLAILLAACAAAPPAEEAAPAVATTAPTAPSASVPAAGTSDPGEPIRHVYAQHATGVLSAFVFRPDPQRFGATLRPAIVILHGGGWAIGEPSWGFARARHYAGLGLVAVVLQYRLSNQKDITPLEAMADARAGMRWLRENAARLGIDGARIAAYGWSAGAHLAVSAALFEQVDASARMPSRPDALILVSPAVALEQDPWPQRLLGARAHVRDISPDRHLRAGLPPLLILQGRTDTVTPAAAVERFCAGWRAARNRCELQVYEGVGHLFTPASLPDNSWPQPDPAVQADAQARADAFLRELGFLR